MSKALPKDAYFTIRDQPGNPVSPSPPSGGIPSIVIILILLAIMGDFYFFL